MARISYNDVDTAMLEAIPELREAYAAELARWGDERPGHYSIYGNVLVPHLFALLEVGTDSSALERLFSLIETLATHDDVRVRELVIVAVLEVLIAKDARLSAARRYMGAQTRQLIEGMRG